MMLDLEIGEQLRTIASSELDFKTLQNGLYRYDAIARLQDVQNEDTNTLGIGEYIKLKLGALGTAFLQIKNQLSR